MQPTSISSSRCFSATAAAERLVFNFSATTNCSTGQTTVRIAVDSDDQQLFTYTAAVTDSQVTGSLTYLSAIKSQLDFLPVTYIESHCLFSGRQEMSGTLWFAADRTFPVRQLGYFATSLLETVDGGGVLACPMRQLEPFIRQQLGASIPESSLQQLIDTVKQPDLNRATFDRTDLVSSFSTTLADFLTTQLAVDRDMLYACVNSSVVQLAAQTGLLKTREDLQPLLQATVKPGSGIRRL